jgi:hypothetical protein
MTTITKKSTSLNEAVSSELKKGFDLNKFKDKKLLNSNVKFKEQKWIPVSEALSDIISLPGIPMGHITLLRGHSDTGKTTALIEAAVNAQKAGILPVLIVTEMKFDFGHLKTMGFDVNEVIDPVTGEIQNYEGFFIYADRSSLQSVEDVAAFILDLLDEQTKGNLPYDLLFLWDSVGSIPCKMSIEKSSNSNEWNAGAMSQQFGNFVNQKIVLSRKENSPYTNTFVCVNKVWVEKPSMPMEQPKMKNKGGNTMFFDASLIVTFGNIANAGTNKIKAVKDKKDVEFAKRTKVSVDKNHINGISTRGAIIMTAHGFIKDTPASVDKYKKEHADEWAKILGGTNFKIVTEDEANGEVDTSED